MTESETHLSCNSYGLSFSEKSHEKSRRHVMPISTAWSAAVAHACYGGMQHSSLHETMQITFIMDVLYVQVFENNMDATMNLEVISKGRSSKYFRN